MNVIIIYDSYFGNTLKVAEMYQKEFLASKQQAEIKHVDQTGPKDIEDRDLIIVGSPTRGFRESSAMMSFLRRKDLRFSNKNVFVFDTRISPEDVKSKLLRQMMKWFGYAASNMEKRLKKHGATIVMPAIGYPVVSSEGPVKPEVAFMIEIDVRKLINPNDDKTIAGATDEEAKTNPKTT